MANDSEMPIPSALIEDIIADVELMKGQSMRLGSDKFQVFEDVCLSVGGLSDLRADAMKPEQMIQVMLIHSQLADLPKQKMPNDGEEVNFHELEQCTIQHQLP